MMLFGSNRALSCSRQGSCGPGLIYRVFVLLTLWLLLKWIGASHPSFSSLESRLGKLLVFGAFRALRTHHRIAGRTAHALYLLI